MLLHFFLLYSDFLNAVDDDQPIQICGDPLLQVQLVVVCPDVSQYILLLKYVAVPIIMVALALKLDAYQSLDEVCSQEFVELFHFHSG